MSIIILTYKQITSVCQLYTPPPGLIVDFEFFTIESYAAPNGAFLSFEFCTP